MRKSAAAKKTRDKVRAHRDKLRKQGLRPIQIWVPDVRSPRFKAEARRQSKLLAADPNYEEDMKFLDAAQAWIWQN